VQGVEDVELICEFRGAQGMGSFDVSSLRLLRLPDKTESAKPN
jgi:hypothetical protein